MNTLTSIALKGLAVAKENGLVAIPEKYKILFDEDLIKNFIKVQITDLFEFATLEQFLSNENLFARAFMYTYGKGAELAISHIVHKPLKRIGYDFDNCMRGNGTVNIPSDLLIKISSNSSVLLKMYNEMFEVTRGSQEKLINEGSSFEDCMFKTLNVAFNIGKRVALALDVDKNIIMDFNSNDYDSKYDYDNYDQKYSEEDYKLVNYKIGDFNAIKNLPDKTL